MSNVLQALEALDVAALSYQEWVNVGMALHAEGFDWSVWDNSEASLPNFSKLIRWWIR